MSEGSKIRRSAYKKICRVLSRFGFVSVCYEQNWLIGFVQFRIKNIYDKLLPRWWRQYFNLCKTMQGFYILILSVNFINIFLFIYYCSYVVHYTLLYIDRDGIKPASLDTDGKWHRSMSKTKDNIC